MSKKCLHFFHICQCLYLNTVHFSLNHNITKWLMGFLWPWTCTPNKSNQLPVESPWMSVPNVRKFPGGVYELLCSREWNRHMDDRTRRKRYASSNDKWWHRRQHPVLITKKNSCFYIFWCLYQQKSVIHILNEWSRSTGINTAIQSDHEIMINSKRLFNPSITMKDVWCAFKDPFQQDVQKVK